MNLHVLCLSQIDVTKQEDVVKRQRFLFNDFLSPTQPDLTLAESKQHFSVFNCAILSWCFFLSSGHLPLICEHQSTQPTERSAERERAAVRRREGARGERKAVVDRRRVEAWVVRSVHGRNFAQDRTPHATSHLLRERESRRLAARDGSEDGVTSRAEVVITS